MEVGKMPAESKANQSKRLTAAGLIAVTAATLLMMAWAVFPAALSATAAPDLCPGEPGAPPATIIGSGGSTGSFSQGGVTIMWSGTTVTITGGTVTFCVKGGTSGSTGSITLGPGTYSTADLGLVGPQGQAQEISHLVVYGVTPPTSSSTTTTTAGGGGGGVTTTTTTTSTTTTTTIPTVAPTTIHKSTTEETTTDEVLATTVRPGGTAFTGVENVVPIGALALMLMTSGTGLLWAGARRRRQDGSEDED
jgi:hypothetical protein